MCACERERERERGVSVCVCACVCERERLCVGVKLSDLSAWLALYAFVTFMFVDHLS